MALTLLCNLLVACQALRPTSLIWYLSKISLPEVTQLAEQEGPTPSRRRKQRALLCLVGGFGAGIAVGAVIGVTLWTPLAGLALGISLGAGMGGVPASLYYFGDFE